MSLELHGAPWSSTELHGAPWSSMELHGAQFSRKSRNKSCFFDISTPRRSPELSLRLIVLTFREKVDPDRSQSSRSSIFMKIKKKNKNQENQEFRQQTLKKCFLLARSFAPARVGTNVTLGIFI